MLVLLGPSGSGKSALQKEIANSFNMPPLIVYSTRPLRQNEVDGVDTHYVSEDEFKMLLNVNFFVCTSEHNGWLYGIAKEDCQDNCVAAIVPSWLRQLLQHPSISPISFYLKVGRRERLIKVLQRGDDIEEAVRRSSSDEGMFEGLEKEVSFVISNNNYEQSVKELAESVVGMYRNIQN